jgi:hypothetical protein
MVAHEQNHAKSFSVAGSAGAKIRREGAREAIEGEPIKGHNQTVVVVQTALESAGVEFQNDGQPGVRLRSRPRPKGRMMVGRPGRPRSQLLVNHSGLFLPPWGSDLTIPKKQRCERFEGATPFLTRTSTS